jgi:hypothetical protein
VSSPPSRLSANGLTSTLIFTSWWLYANAHAGKVRKASPVPLVLGTMEDESRRLPSKGWAEMIRKAYEVEPLLCPRCGGRMNERCTNKHTNLFLKGHSASFQEARTFR